MRSSAAYARCATLSIHQSLTMDQTLLVTVLVFLLVVQAVWAVIGISSNDRVRAIRRLSSYTEPTSDSALQMRYSVLRRRRYR